MRQIISIDEKNQIMTSSFYLACQWQDGRLKWTPSSILGNLTETGIFRPLSHSIFG
jgi:hypothetical protein